MSRRWTIEEEIAKREELIEFYEKQNKTIGEIGNILGIAESTVFDRMKRLDILSHPERKSTYCNKRQDIKIPHSYSAKLAEFVGVMLGDGHVSLNQIVITVNKNESDYIEYLKKLMKRLFKVEPHQSGIKTTGENRSSVVDIYIGSVQLVKYFLSMGLVTNKVKRQVGVAKWITENKEYGKRFLRGFFDTDGSIYKLRFGVQISYKNYSKPLLDSTRQLLTELGYNPSRTSNQTLYLTRKKDLKRFFREIKPRNRKHIERAKSFGAY